MTRLKQHIKVLIASFKKLFNNYDQSEEWKEIKIRPLLFKCMKMNYNYKFVNGAKILFDVSDKNSPEIWVTQKCVNENGELIDSMTMIAKYDMSTGIFKYHNSFLDYIDEPIIKNIS